LVRASETVHKPAAIREIEVTFRTVGLNVKAHSLTQGLRNGPRHRKRGTNMISEAPTAERTEDLRPLTDTELEYISAGFHCVKLIDKTSPILPLACAD
jgi:hypothetical protein